MKKYLFTTALAIAGYLAGQAQTGMYISGPVSNWGSASYGVGNGTNAFRVVTGGSYTAATGATDVFYNTGSNAEIAGAVAPAFYNATFNVGAGIPMAISNTAGASIGGTLSWNNGLITTVRSNTNAGALKFTAGAAYNAILTDSRFVDGYVSKIGNTAFIFPIGAGADMRTLGISAPAAIATEISAAWLPGSPSTTTDPSDPSGSALHTVTSVGAGISAVSTAGQWDWIPVTAATNAITITASIPDVSTFSTATSLRLVGWNGSQWINLSTGTGTSSATGNTENSTVTGIVPTGTTITALAVGASALPDLTPGVQLPFNSFSTVGQARQFLVDVQELNSIATSNGTVQFSVTIPSGYTVDYNSTQTSATVSGLGTVAVSNANWTVVATAFSGRKLTLQAKAGVGIGAGGLARIGFTATRTATALAGGTPVITVNVVDDAGQTYDSESSNNIFTRIINTQ